MQVADLRSYDNDDTAPTKESIPAQPAAPTASISLDQDAAGYGEEPQTSNDITSFEDDAHMNDHANNGMAPEPTNDSVTVKVESGIQMKEDG
jgi:hypothetical protein